MKPTSLSAPGAKGTPLEFSQFYETSVRIMIALTCTGGILVALFGRDWGLHNLQVGLVSLAFIVPGLLALALFSRNFLACIWCLFLDWLGCALILLLAFPSHPPLVLFMFPVSFAILFLSPWVGLLTWIVTGSFSFIWVHYGVPTQGNGDAYLLFFSIGALILMIWLVTRSYREMILWSWENYNQNREELDQAREQRGQLNQAIHDLAEANTQMMRLNQLLNAARYQAEEAERVKAEFVANVSHELRTPLNMILGYCELIMDFPAVYGAKLPARLLADIAAIQRNSQHLTGLINDVLDISQIEAKRMSLRREWGSIRSVIDEAIIAVKPLIESRSLYLQTYIPDELPPMYIDQTRIRQVLLNLVSNAARVTENGGITLLVERLDEELKISVSDTGPGIAREDLPKLFQPFRQLEGGLNRRHSGSGLGLNISRNFIELHKGKIGVESQMGKGSCFWFTLPVYDKPDQGNSFERWLSSDYETRLHPTYANPQHILPRVVILEQSSLFYEQAGSLINDIDMEIAHTPEEAMELLSASPCQAIIVRGENERHAREWADKVRDTRFGTLVATCCLPKEDFLGRLEVERYLLKPVDHRQLFEVIDSLHRPIRSILLVDDDSETLQLFTRILTTAPNQYRVLQSTDGQEALNLMRSRKVDLVILDLYMPGMDGFGFLKEKNKEKRWKDIPVVILTAEDPATHPQVVPELTISRSHGLSISEIFRYTLRISKVEGDPNLEPGSG